MTFPPCRAVVLDMDGTMFDTEILYHHAETELLRRRGKEFSTELSLAIMGVPGREAMKIVARTLNLADDPDDLFNESQVILRRLMETELRLMPGLDELLTLLEQRGLPKGVATSTQRELTEDMLGRFDLLRRFGFILTREDVERPKPAPEIYEKACAILGLSPREVLVLEDSFNGTKAAVDAGCQVVAIPHELSRALSFDHVHAIAERLLDPVILERIGVSEAA